MSDVLRIDVMINCHNILRMITSLIWQCHSPKASFLVLNTFFTFRSQQLQLNFIQWCPLCFVWAGLKVAGKLFPLGLVTGTIPAEILPSNKGKPIEPASKQMFLREDVFALLDATETSVDKNSSSKLTFTSLHYLRSFECSPVHLKLLVVIVISTHNTMWDWVLLGHFIA